MPAATTTSDHPNSTAWAKVAEAYERALGVGLSEAERESFERQLQSVREALDWPPRTEVEA